MGAIIQKPQCLTICPGGFSFNIVIDGKRGWSDGPLCIIPRIRYDGARGSLMCIVLEKFYQFKNSVLPKARIWSLGFFLMGYCERLYVSEALRLYAGTEAPYHSFYSFDSSSDACKHRREIEHRLDKQQANT
ncbi:hypothetical protein AVEN_204409-1 [Araneus ventricosus]|uniref:Uncharacterized protein n=1 Tax=Araneus ventricosus TaxID=182803 RepID=A0A4Y2LTX2_ARAVE|nr:hypothetical protein AVEN_204409-1 [Araneus ventricosus]